jgi:hypothetical protein
LLTTPERCEKHQQFKLNQFKKSIMDEYQLNELRRQQKQASYDKFVATHGINYHTYNRWSKISGLKDIQAVIEYRDKRRPVITHCNRGERFKTKYGITIWEWNKAYKPLGYTLETLLERKYQLDKNRLELESLKIEPTAKTKIIQIPKAKPIYSKPKIKIPMILTKEQAYTQMQNKICDLERLITIPEIRDMRINKLKVEFNNNYGAV